MAQIDHISAGPTTSHQLLSPSKEDNGQPRQAGSKASKIASTLLAGVNFERRNKPQPRLPPNHQIQKRPIAHPPIAAPYAGSDVQKVVYVSRATPIMAAVKRVKKLLEQAEKRTLQREGVLGTAKRAGSNISATQHKHPAKHEEVLVKGSGRAIEQVVKVGEWFKRHAADGDGGWVVTVQATSVKVIDDIVESPTAQVHDSTSNGGSVEDNPVVQERLQAAQGKAFNTKDQEGHEKQQVESGNDPRKGDEHPSEGARTAKRAKDYKAKKRKRPMYDQDDVPEARTRFIHAIEIAISLQR